MPEMSINREEREPDIGSVHNKGLPESISREVIDLQEDKKMLVAELREKLRQIDAGESVESQNKKNLKVSLGEDGVMIAESSEGGRYEVTEGQLLTDGVWGLGYELGPDVKRNVRKAYVLGETRRIVGQALDRQIAVIESESNEDEKERKSYQAVLERMNEKKDIFSWDDGHIAEQMVHSLVKKWIIDHNLPLEIIAADLYEDVTNKLDFVIKRKKESVGMAVEAEDSPQVGIQFTLMHRQDAVEGKQKTIDLVLERGMKGEFAVKDIFLVNMHPSYVKRAVNAWKKKKAPGGPDEKLELGAKTDLFEKICAPFLLPAEIEEWKMKIFGQKGMTAKRLKTHV